MAKKPKMFTEGTDDMEAEWPMIESYTTDSGHVVKVFKAAYAAAMSNKYSVRPKAVSL